MPARTHPKDVPILDPLPITVSRPMVLLRLGYRRPSQVPEKISRLIAEVMEKGSGLIRPRAVYEEFDVEDGGAPGVVQVGPRTGLSLRATSRSLQERLAGCRRAVLFAATVGAEVEAWTHDLMEKGEMTRGLLADAFGSSAAIALGLALEEVVARRFAEVHLAPTRRYAPGYGDWTLSDQAPLMALVDASRIGIILTEEHLMLPSKSISGVIGGRQDAPETPASQRT